tara:strand:+ start:100 stop:543 length:444 start_codon:yes stop_codon:yes gene_type:complete
VISDHLFDNLENVKETILESDVVSIFFPFLGKSVIVDSRTNETEGPILLLTDMAKTPKERVDSLKQMRPSFQTINEIVLIPWVRYVSTLKSSGIWEGILDKMFKLGQGKPHGDVDQIMDVLETLERIYLIEVMTGPTWETTWTKQNA